MTPLWHAVYLLYFSSFLKPTYLIAKNELFFFTEKLNKLFSARSPVNVFYITVAFENIEFFVQKLRSISSSKYYPMATQNGRQWTVFGPLYTLNILIQSSKIGYLAQTQKKML